ncbi:hypothetical protein M569_06324, partial [Genlisea aurea]
CMIQNIIIRIQNNCMANVFITPLLADLANSFTTTTKNVKKISVRNQEKKCQSPHCIHGKGSRLRLGRQNISSYSS